MQGPDAEKPDREKDSPNDYVKTMETSGQEKARAIGTIWDTERGYVILKTL